MAQPNGQLIAQVSAIEPHPDPIERARKRQQDAGPHPRYIDRDLPPTARQLAYLRDLGFPGVVKTRRQASDIISEYRHERRGVR